MTGMLKLMPTYYDPRHLPDTKEKLYDLINLDLLSNGKDNFSEPQRNQYMQQINTRRLKRLINRHESLYFEYLTTPRIKFEEKRFNIPVSYR